MRNLSSAKTILVLVIALSCRLFSMQAQSDLNCQDIFNKMFSEINNVKTLRYDLFAIERIDDKFTSGHSIVKLNVAPFKAYYKDLEKGIEVLWTQDLEDGDAIVNPNGFPFVNLHLNPMGKLMRRGQHQTILRLGYAYLGDLLSHSLSKYPDAYKNYVHRQQDTIWDNSPCYKVIIDFTKYTNVFYIITEKGLTVSKIASKNFVSDYEVLTLNNLSWYEDELDLGQKLIVPDAYAKRVVLLISKTSNLPVVIRVYDEKGLFELYEFTNLKVNSLIQDSEFTENYPDYHF